MRLDCLVALACLEAFACLVCFEAFDWDGWDVGNVGWDVAFGLKLLTGMAGMLAGVLAGMMAPMLALAPMLAPHWRLRYHTEVDKLVV